MRKIFGDPGDGINGVLGSLQRAKGSLESFSSRRPEVVTSLVKDDPRESLILKDTARQVLSAVPPGDK